MTLICGIVLAVLVVGIVVWQTGVKNRRRLDMIPDTSALPPIFDFDFDFPVYNTSTSDFVLV